MNEDFLFDLNRIHQWCKLHRDDHKRAEDSKRAGIYIRCMQAIEDVQADLKKDIEKSKPRARD